MLHNIGRISYIFVLIIIQSVSISLAHRPFNLSHYIFPKVSVITESELNPEEPHFLQGVLDAIVKRQKWALEDIQVSKLNVKKAKYGSIRRYEFRVRVEKSEIVLKMYEEPTEWKKMALVNNNGSSNFESLVREIESEVLIDSFKIEGPCELRVAKDDDELSILMPSNTTHTGLRRISVGEGITVEIKNAQEISTFHPSDPHKPPYGILTYNESNKFGSVWPNFCPALLSIRILGSASIVAYRTQRPSSYIQTLFSSREKIELLSEKCHLWRTHKKPTNLFNALSLRIASLEKVLRGSLKERGLSAIKSRIGALNIFHFQLELERYIRSNDTYWSTIADWRTRPVLERVWFEIDVKIENGVLKPLQIKKVRPFIDTDPFAWNSLLSNLSFTKFPSAIVSPEALTLDVKW